MQSFQVVVNTVADTCHITSQPLWGLHVIDRVMSEWKLLLSVWKSVCGDVWRTDTPAAKMLQSISLCSVWGISFSLSLSIFLTVVESVCLPPFVRNRILKHAFLVCCSYTYKITCTAAQRQNAHTALSVQAHILTAQPTITQIWNHSSTKTHKFVKTLLAHNKCINQKLAENDQL